MIIALMMLQIVFVVLEYPAHEMFISPWAVFLPALLIAFLWVIAIVIRSKLVLDVWRFSEMFKR